MKAFQDFFAKLREINARYREPRIEMSRAVRASLLALRLYIFVLAGLMIYKFMLLAMGR